MINFTLKQLEERCQSRPKGYYQDVMAVAKPKSEDIYEISESDYETISRKYRLPNLWQEILNISTSVTNLIESGIEFRSSDEIKENLIICANCPFLVEKEFRCGVCGCFLKAKVRIRAWDCPQKKWPIH